MDSEWIHASTIDLRWQRVNHQHWRDLGTHQLACSMRSAEANQSQHHEKCGGLHLEFLKATVVGVD